MSWERKVKLKPSDVYSNYFHVEGKPKMHCNSYFVRIRREFYAEIESFHRYGLTDKHFLQIACTSSRGDSFPFSCVDNKRMKTGRVVAGALK